MVALIEKKKKKVEAQRLHMDFEICGRHVTDDLIKDMFDTIRNAAPGNYIPIQFRVERIFNPILVIRPNQEHYCACATMLGSVGLVIIDAIQINLDVSLYVCSGVDQRQRVKVSPLVAGRVGGSGGKPARGGIWTLVVGGGGWSHASGERERGGGW
ncbi:hypothetical protein Tco_1375895 [Tanacetum coccineum]